ncbi:hypothetical protein [Paraburkholderia sp. MM6662-R1]|uniref:hypothetical protein n=1 Tax=Paraburkholderia sp. MM6662-R1 TaxID=2991066 RepID=UPI003D2213E5
MSNSRHADRSKRNEYNHPSNNIARPDRAVGRSKTGSDAMSMQTRPVPHNECPHTNPDDLFSKKSIAKPGYLDKFSYRDATIQLSNTSRPKHARSGGAPYFSSIESVAAVLMSRLCCAATSEGCSPTNKLDAALASRLPVVGARASQWHQAQTIRIPACEQVNNYPSTPAAQTGEPITAFGLLREIRGIQAARSA